MLLIRRFEERTEEQYTRARIGGYCHLAIGEEAAQRRRDRPDGATATTCSRATATTARRWPSAPSRTASWPSCSARRPASRAATAARCTCSTSSATSWAAGASSAGSCRSPSASALALDYESKPNAVLCQLGEGATNIGAFHESLNLAADLEPADRLPGHQQPLRHGHVGRDGLGRARAVEARRGLPHARRARRRQRPAGGARGRRPPAAPRARRAAAGAARDDDLPLPRALGGRRGQGLPRGRGGRRGARSTIRSTASWRQMGIDAETRRAPAQRGQRRDRRRHPPGRRRSGARSGAVSTTTSTAIRTGASSSRAWSAAGRSASGRGRAHGGRDLSRGAAARARRGARARRQGLPHGRGDRPLRGLLQGHGRASTRSTARGACARRRSPRRASSAPASAPRCSACGRSSRS